MADIIVECGHCGWRGKQSELTHAVIVQDSETGEVIFPEAKYCPNCLAQFKTMMPAPPRK